MEVIYHLYVNDYYLVLYVLCYNITKSELTDVITLQYVKIIN